MVVKVINFSVQKPCFRYNLRQNCGIAPFIYTSF